MQFSFFQTEAPNRVISLASSRLIFKQHVDASVVQGTYLCTLNFSVRFSFLFSRLTLPWQMQRTFYQVQVL